MRETRHSVMIVNKGEELGQETNWLGRDSHCGSILFSYTNTVLCVFLIISSSNLILMTPLLYPHSTQHNKTSLSLSLSLSLFHELTHSVAHALFQIWRSHITLSFKRYAFFSLAIFFFFVWSPHSPKICFFLIALWMQASSVSSCCFTSSFICIFLLLYN